MSEEPLAVTAIEKTGDEDRPIRKYYVASETKALKNGDVESFVSTEAIDRMGDIIRASGWQLDNYRKTGSPVLFGHDQRDLIGTAVEIEVQRGGLWAVTRFHEKTQRSREYAALAREGIMKSWSVGFDPMEKPNIRKDDDGNFLGFIFTKQELLEYSLVSVPANPEAVSKAMKMAEDGMISRNTLYDLAGPSPLAEVKDGTPELSHEKEINQALVGQFARALHSAAVAKLLKAAAGKHP